MKELFIVLLTLVSSVCSAHFSPIEELGPSVGEYILPTEFENHVYQVPLQKLKPGTLIAVGTFRAWFDLVMGKFDRAIFLDFDSKIIAFNQANLDLILELSRLPNMSLELQRYTYLSILSNKSLPTQVVSRITHLKMSSREKITQLLSHFENIDPLSIEHLPFQIRAKAKNLIQLLNEVFIKTNQNRDGFKILLTSLKYLSNDASRSSMTYWCSDSTWLKITAFCLAGKLEIVNGNLIGNRTLRELGNQLRSLGQIVSVLDISNVLPFVLSDLKTAKNAMIALTRNINGLPTNGQTLVLFTDIADTTVDLIPFYHLKNQDRFFYFMIPVKRFLEEAHFDSVNTYYRSLAQNLFALTGAHLEEAEMRFLDEMKAKPYRNYDCLRAGFQKEIAGEVNSLFLLGLPTKTDFQRIKEFSQTLSLRFKSKTNGGFVGSSHLLNW